MSTQLGSITSLEWQDAPREAPRRSPVRRWYAVAAVLLVGWSLVGLWPDEGGVLNLDGWSQFARFWTAATAPELSADFLDAVATATLTTVAFAVLGTVLAVLGGLVLGALVSETWWRRPGGTRLTPARRTGWIVTRVGLSVPRGVHEAVWALFLLSVMGSNPLVGVLAIAIPFGVITAKVYAEMIDETDHRAYDALRRTGAGRTVALAYGVLPQALTQITSYAFYRLECAIRSSVIIGMIGAGGLGFQLMMSFQGLAYGEMWTVIYVIALLSAAADIWGSALRRRPGARGLWRASVVVVAVGVVAGWQHLGPDLGRLFSAPSRALFTDTLGRMVPPSLPDGGLSELVSLSVETLQMSLVAGMGAFLAAVAVCFLAARATRGPVGATVSVVARGVLLLCRSIPSPVWAVLVLFLMLPGPLPGAIALGLYNFGILGRLCAEVVENLDARPRVSLQRIGASGLTSFAYATLPAASAQLVSYGVYRWEVAARETIALGVVAAGGLGVLLQQQRAAFDYAAMTSTVLAMVVICAVVDLAGAAVRSALR